MMKVPLPVGKTDLIAAIHEAESGDKIMNIGSQRPNTWESAAMQNLVRGGVYLTVHWLQLSSNPNCGPSPPTFALPSRRTPSTFCQGRLVASLLNATSSPVLLLISCLGCHVVKYFPPNLSRPSKYPPLVGLTTTCPIIRNQNLQHCLVFNIPLYLRVCESGSCKWQSSQIYRARASS
jgi:hypothetical protein